MSLSLPRPKFSGVEEVLASSTSTLSRPAQVRRVAVVQFYFLRNRASAFLMNKLLVRTKNIINATKSQYSLELLYIYYCTYMHLSLELGLSIVIAKRKTIMKLSIPDGHHAYVAIRSTFGYGYMELMHDACKVNIT
jgi:hypothetical protein